MKIEKLDRVAITVRNLDEAVRLFSDLLGTTFTKVPKTGQKVLKIITEHADRAFEEAPIKAALSPIGIELIEAASPTEKEGIRAFHLKVSDYEEAKSEMKAKGIRLLAEIEVGDLKEAIYSPDDLHGARILLVEYQTPIVQ